MKCNDRAAHGEVMVQAFKALGQRLARIDAKLDAIITISLAQLAVLLVGLWALWSELASLSARLAG